MSMSETLLTLDIGVTTGYAVFVNRELVDYSQTTVLSEALPQLLSRHIPDVVVVEQPVIYRGELGDKLGQIMAIAHYFLDGARRTVLYIDPAEWKNSPAKRYDCPKGTSAHEKDAIRMGKW